MADVTELPGVGPVLQSRLENAGITTIADLALVEPIALLEVPGIGRRRGSMLIVQARAALGDEIIPLLANDGANSDEAGPGRTENRESARKGQQARKNATLEKSQKAKKDKKTKKNRTAKRPKDKGKSKKKSTGKPKQGKRAKKKKKKKKKP